MPRATPASRLRTLRGRLTRDTPVLHGFKLLYTLRLTDLHNRKTNIQSHLDAAIARILSFSNTAEDKEKALLEAEQLQTEIEKVKAEAKMVRATHGRSIEELAVELREVKREIRELEEEIRRNPEGKDKRGKGKWGEGGCGGCNGSGFVGACDPWTF